MNLKYLGIMDKTEKDLKELLDIAFQDVDLDSPSANFTDGVMKQIELSESKVMFSYKPIISKKVLGVIFLLFMVLLGYLATQADLSSSNWFDKAMGSKLMTEISVPSVELPVSRILVYVIGTIGLLIMIQTTLLKGYFEKRLA